METDNEDAPMAKISKAFEDPQSVNNMEQELKLNDEDAVKEWVRRSNIVDKLRKEINTLPDLHRISVEVVDRLEQFLPEEQRKLKTWLRQAQVTANVGEVENE
jgi:ribosomal protein S19